MAIEYKKNMAIFHDVVSVDDAEELREWLQNKSDARIDLEDCTHLHPENLQVMIAAQSCIAFWPAVLSSLAGYSGKAWIGDGSVFMVRNVEELA